jgi:hypothetical protein
LAVTAVACQFDLRPELGKNRIIVRKISRRLFLLALLAACSPIRTETDPGPTETLPTFLPIPTLFPLPTIFPYATDSIRPRLAPSPSPAAILATQEATPAPINVVMPDGDPDCGAPIISPTQPAVIPPLGGVDAATGRHVMGTVQVLDLRSYRLKVTGMVNHPLSLTLDDLRCMPKITETVTTTCYNFADTATWSGVLISDVLKKAGVKSGAKKIIQMAADDANRSLPLEQAMDAHNFLAYEMGDNPLPVLFGFPLRSIFIDVAGQYSVKWLTSLVIA